MKYLLSISLLLLSNFSWAADLEQVMQDALEYDASYQSAKANLSAIQENTAIARAQLLPSLRGNISYSGTSNTAVIGISESVASAQLSLSQSLFNMVNWINYENAKYNVQAALADFAATQQELIVRVAENYLAIIQAQNQLKLSLQNRDSLKRTLEDVKLRFQSGLVKTSDVDTAQAAYDGSLTTVLTDQNTLDSRQADLKVLSGKVYPYLAPFKENIPLNVPEKSSLSADNNLTLLSQQFATKAAEANMRANQAQHYPTLSANITGSFTSDDSLNFARGVNSTIGANLTIPLYSGGQISAQERQAAYQYQAQRFNENQTKHLIGKDITTQWQTAKASVEKLKADTRIILSQKKALKSTRFAYDAGLSHVNITSVLEAQQSLFRAQISYSIDQVEYILSLLRLKKATGELSLADISLLNQWLTPKPS